MDTLNSYKIKWAILVSVSDKGFNRNYKAALKNSGFTPVGHHGDVYAISYNSNNPESIRRVNACIDKLKAKFQSFKYKKSSICFTITDKQFGLIGSEKVQKLSMRKVPSSIGVIPVTSEQLIYSGNFMNQFTHKP